MKVSKVAGFITYRSVSLGNNALIYNIFPYYLILSVILLVAVSYDYLMLMWKIHSQTLDISREIDTATLTSRAFCHYMKNELLSIMAVIDGVKDQTLNNPSSIALNEIHKKCQTIYTRLDVAHQKKMQK